MGRKRFPFRQRAVRTHYALAGLLHKAVLQTASVTAYLSYPYNVPPEHELMAAVIASEYVAADAQIICLNQDF